MHPARRIAAVLLLAFWLPAMLHCRLEAAGFSLGSDCCAATHSEAAPADSCADDACDVAEGSFVKPSVSSADAPAPVLSACLMSSALLFTPAAVSPPPVTGIVEAATAPPELERTWAFASRAALSPRAP